MTTLLILILLVAAAVLLWIRFSPVDPDDWHVDPAEDTDRNQAGLRLIGLEAPRFPGDAETVLGAFIDIATAEPRVRVLDGSLSEGMVTLVARSAMLGLPEFVTVKAVAEGRATKLAIASRSRFRGSEGGSRAARLDRWIKELEQTLGGRLIEL